MKIKNTILFFVLSFCFITSANEPVGVIRVQNSVELLKKSTIFLSKGDRQGSERFGLAIGAKFNEPEYSSLDFTKPLTAYLYFSNSTLQSVVFGTLLPNKRPKTLPFLPGQHLVPEVKGNRQVVFADPKFKPHVKGLQEGSIKLPQSLVAGQYIFRDVIKLPGQTAGSDLAEWVSSEFEKFSFTANFPAEDLLNVVVELEARKNSGMFHFSNENYPEVKESPLVLPKPEFYFYTVFPANQSAARGLIDIFASVEPDFLNDEHVYGCFLHSVVTEDHNGALALSKYQDFYLISGILPTAEKKEHFEKFLKSHGDSYSGKAYIFHNGNGTNAYVYVIGNKANLLIRKQDGNGNVVQMLGTMRPLQKRLGKRNFAVAELRKADGSYEQMLSIAMANGKFRLTANLRPAAVLKIIPSLLMGEDLFHE